MKKIFLIFCLLIALKSVSHTITNSNLVLRNWTIENKKIAASFLMFKNGNVYLEDDHGNVTNYPLAELSGQDLSFVMNKARQIEDLNHDIVSKENSQKSIFNFNLKFGTIALILLLLTVFILRNNASQKVKYLVPILGVVTLFFLYGFTKKIFTTTDPIFVNSAFAPFVSTVATNWDNTYFYVQSKGIPNHTMMVGISNHGWQQQVPVPQCYIGNNHWSIPLNPVLATTPVPVSSSHFLRGAIAIAANGVPIFNYHTNTGVDSFLDGQLDNYGGHCGRADDYHYHTAPMHLYTLGQTTTNLPCAFALDGFAVYGAVEPDGSAMNTLDANHGHNGSNGVYHYHGTATAPYMIGSMVGVVTEDATLQIVPQASAQPVRNGNYTPLNGALITSCVANATNTGYNTAYSLNGTAGYATNYSWNGTTYTFNYVTPTGSTTTNYNGFAQCLVPLSTIDYGLENKVALFPNPAKENFQINLDNAFLENDVQNISIIDSKGSLIQKINKFKSVIDIQNLYKGIYFIKIQFSNGQLTKKLIVQ